MNAGPSTTLPRGRPLIPIRDYTLREQGSRSKDALQRATFLGEFPALPIGMEVSPTAGQPGPSAVDNEIVETDQPDQFVLFCTTAASQAGSHG